MGELLIARQQLVECSAVIQDTIEKAGVTLEHDPAAVRTLALHVLNRVVPELTYFYKRPTQVEADMTLAEIEDEAGLRRFNSASFTGTLSHLSDVELVTKEEDELFGSLETERVDILLGFTPAFSEPDPADLVFSSRVVVPLSETDKLVRSQD